MRALTITCETCTMRDSHACGDCLMTYFCDEAADGDAAPHAGAVVLDLDEERAVRMLVSAGLVPTIRHRATG